MFNKKKQFDKRYLLILIIVVIALALVVLAVSLKKDRNLSLPERIIKDSGITVLRVVNTPFKVIKNKLDDIHKKNNIYKKYEKIKKKTDEMDKVKAANKNLENEVKKLKDALKLNTVLSNKVACNATIVSRNVGYWYEEVTIDKGKKDGISKNMAVVNSNGLIGRIIKVSNHYSTVKLLSNDNMDNKISVKIAINEDFVYGLISNYDSKTNTYTVEGISQNVDIPEGADVVTTGMGTTFPSGLLIGKVKKITKDNFDLSKVVEVNSAVNFDDIDYVTVLKREVK
ncbi:MAG: rod shape-determining protein MreC [Bacilli bacterium]|nr:rod shape-determining protein MreC [Bacilli bacterium]